ncbi:lysozyme inhibitor LprI family protein [Leisingera daeponensis]|uniref:lysozyme inhibitor LprI family protein n=1 Tax=Leisingera daeponensis TaxID=405746 RepID=UPI0003FD98F1|nr:lysozyme inhibitor LprI family protein [Leisingera daeponensis]
MRQEVPAMLRRVIGVLIVLTQPVSADPALECGNAGSQVEIGECVAKDEERVEAALATALSFALTSAEDLDEATGRSDAVPALESGQKAWEAYREEHCAFVGATYGGGSGTGIAIRSCRTQLGRARIDELMRYAG